MNSPQPDGRVFRGGKAVYGAPLGYTVEITANKFVDSEPTKAAVVQVDDQVTSEVETRVIRDHWPCHSGWAA